MDEEASTLLMEEQRAQVLARIRDERVQVVELQFSDITGGAKSLTIPVSILPNVLEHGYRFDGSALTGLRKIELTLALLPDPDTMIIFPAQVDVPRRAQLSCTVRRLDGSFFPGDPRSVLIQTVERARTWV